MIAGIGARVSGATTRFNVSVRIANIDAGPPIGREASNILQTIRPSGKSVIAVTVLPHVIGGGRNGGIIVTARAYIDPPVSAVGITGSGIDFFEGQRRGYYVGNLGRVHSSNNLCVLIDILTGRARTLLGYHTLGCSSGPGTVGMLEVLTFVGDVPTDSTHLNFGVSIIVTHPLLAEVVILFLVFLLCKPAVLARAVIGVLCLIQVRVGCGLVPRMACGTPLNVATSRTFILTFTLCITDRAVSIVWVVIAVLSRNLSVVLGLHIVALIHPLGVITVAAVLLILVLRISRLLVDHRVIAQPGAVLVYPVDLVAVAANLLTLMPGLTVLPVGVLVDIVVTLVHPPGVATVTADLLPLVLVEALLLVVVIEVPGMACVYPASNRGATAGAVLLILMVGLILALVLHWIEVGPIVRSVVDPLLSAAGADLLSLLLIGVGRVRTILGGISHLPRMGMRHAI